jgi:hypothetical protein
MKWEVMNVNFAIYRDGSLNCRIGADWNRLHL